MGFPIPYQICSANIFYGQIMTLSENALEVISEIPGGVCPQTPLLGHVLTYTDGGLFNPPSSQLLLIYVVYKNYMYMYNCCQSISEMFECLCIQVYVTCTFCLLPNILRSTRTPNDVLPTIRPDINKTKLNTRHCAFMFICTTQLLFVDEPLLVTDYITTLFQNGSDHRVTACYYTRKSVSHINGVWPSVLVNRASL